MLGRYIECSLGPGHVGRARYDFETAEWPGHGPEAGRKSFCPPRVLLDGTYNSYATIPAVHEREILVGLWRRLRSRLVRNAHIETVASIGRVEAIGGHSTQRELRGEDNDMATA